MQISRTASDTTISLDPAEQFSYDGTRISRVRIPAPSPAPAAEPSVTFSGTRNPLQTPHEFSLPRSPALALLQGSTSAVQAAAYQAATPAPAPALRPATAPALSATTTHALRAAQKGFRP